MFSHGSIIGLGLLGGSLALDLRQQFPQMTITGIARRPATLAEAEALRVGERPVFTHLSCDLAAVRTADLIVLCTPVQTSIEQLVAMAPLVSPGTVVTDVGSTKRMVMNAAATALPAGAFFVGGHPMAGSDRAGLAHVRAGLYRQATWALCPPPGAEDAAARLAVVLEALEARVRIIDADSHDRLVALTSHLPHAVACALAARVLGHPDAQAVRAFIAGGFRDTTRIAAGQTAMWRDIFQTNRDNMVHELNAIIADLEQWRDALRAGDPPHLEALLTHAHTLREELNHPR